MPGDVPISEAIGIQNTLRSQVRLEKLQKLPALIAGADVSSSRGSNELFGGIIVLTFPSLEEVERAFAKQEATFPYVPGFLSFRELPVLLKAFEKLRHKPDLVFVDGQGIAHPRRLGIAAHLGLELGLPTIGVAKSLLHGTGKEPPPEKGAYEYLYDGAEVVGAKVRTKARCKPLIVSPGHRITVDESIQFVLATCRGYRLPEPTRRAHVAVKQFRQA